VEPEDLSRCLSQGTHGEVGSDLDGCEELAGLREALASDARSLALGLGEDRGTLLAGGDLATLGVLDECGDSGRRCEWRAWE